MPEATATASTAPPTGAAISAVFPGTFDPITLGHQDLIGRIARLFPRVVVAVAAAHHKKTLFSLDERLDAVRAVVAPWTNVEVLPFSGLLVEFASSSGASVMVRGVRSVTDYDYEAQLAGMNRVMNAGVDTMFLTPDARFQFLSSTLVREIASLHGDVSAFVSPLVQARLRDKLGA
jgi:pantetheine-phosphate adenylyltransferase